MADRYCGNCGQELREDNRFCPSCGRPVHETAHVPTPEADVPVPPPPQPLGTTAASPPQDQGTEPTEWWQSSTGKALGITVAIFAVLSILATLAGGEETSTQADKAKKQQEAKETPEQGNRGDQEPAIKPKLVVSSPSKSTTVTTSSIDVEGKVSPPDADVTVNGQTITPYNDNGAFKQIYLLDMGENAIKITATNGSKQVEYSRVVTRKLSEKEIAAKKAAEKEAAKEAAEEKAAEEAAAKKAAEEAAAKEAAEKKAAEKAAAKKRAAEAAKNAAVGDTVGVGNVEWTVSDAFLTNQLNSTFGTHKRGRFVVVDFTFTNNRDEQVTLDPDLHMVLKDSEGREFGTDPGAYEFMPTDLDVFLEPVNPGVSTNGRVIYPVPPDANGFTLKLDDVEFFEDKSAVFDLGNIPLRAYEDPASASATASASAGP